LPAIVEVHKIRIKKVIQQESQGPQNHALLFDKYANLISKKAEEEVESFLKEEHSFNDYEKEVKKYQRLIKEIAYGPQKVVNVGMFELHCEELIRALAKRAEGLLNKLLEKMLNEHFEMNKQ
jgi:dynein heavy chain, axonemal